MVLVGRFAVGALSAVAVLLSRSAVGSRLSIRVSVGMLCVRSRLSLFLRQEKRDGLRDVAFSIPPWVGIAVRTFSKAVRLSGFVSSLRA